MIVNLEIGQGALIVKDIQLNSSKHVMWTPCKSEYGLEIEYRVLISLYKSNGLIRVSLFLYFVLCRFGWILMKSMRLPTPTAVLTSGSWSRMVLSSRSLLLSTPDPELGPIRRPEERDVTVDLVRGRVQQMLEPVRRTCGSREWEFSEDSLRDTGIKINLYLFSFVWFLILWISISLLTHPLFIICSILINLLDQFFISYNHIS